MKRFMRLTGLLCAAVVIAAPVFAQITITSTDVSSQFAPGNYTNTQFDSTASTINIGARGSSSWDFSGLKKSSTVTLTSVAVSGTPYASQYSGATYALQTAIVYQGVPATAYVYLKLATDLLNMGEGAGISGGAATLIATNVPSDLFYKLPSTYLTTWTSTYLDTTVISISNIPIQELSVRHNASYVVDAYGPLTMPGGTIHQVLRIKKTDSTTTYSTSNGTLSFNKGVGYIFIARDGTLVQVSATSTTGPDSGTIGIYPPVSWATAVNTSAPVAGSLPGKFSLEQNYPNPFNPSTVIAYAVPAKSLVHIAVYNVLGQRVADLVNGEVDAGTHEVEWHPSTASGVYLCRIDAVTLDKTASTFSKVQKMAYVR